MDYGGAGQSAGAHQGDNEKTLTDQDEEMQEEGEEMQEEGEEE